MFMNNVYDITESKYIYLRFIVDLFESSFSRTLIF
jgi:hypothetical protein